MSDSDKDVDMADVGSTTVHLPALARLPFELVECITWRLDIQNAKRLYHAIKSSKKHLAVAVYIRSRLSVVATMTQLRRQPSLTTLVPPKTLVRSPVEPSENSVNVKFDLTPLSTSGHPCRMLLARPTGQAMDREYSVWSRASISGSFRR